jgi:uncharacterized membrane protein YebE (DUF533 family)
MTATAFTGRAAHEIAHALAAVAAADGAIVAREASQLDEFAVAHGVGVQIWIAIDTPLDLGRLAHAVPDDAGRHEVLRLCLRMAVADGSYAAPEQTIVTSIAGAFGIPDAELRQLEAAAGLSRP